MEIAIGACGDLTALTIKHLKIFDLGPRKKFCATVMKRIEPRVKIDLAASCCVEMTSTTPEPNPWARLSL